jgi:ribosomal protein L10
MLRQDHVKHGAVVLISDLADDPTDYARLANAVLLFQQSHIPLEIVGLDPRQQDAEFFKNLLGAQAVIQKAALPTSAEARGKLALVGEFPRGLAVAGCLAIALLALNEWWAEPLRWRPRRAT